MEVVGECLNFNKLVCSGVLRAGQEEALPDERTITCYLQTTWDFLWRDLTRVKSKKLILHALSPLLEMQGSKLWLSTWQGEKRDV